MRWPTGSALGSSQGGIAGRQVEVLDEDVAMEWDARVGSGCDGGSDEGELDSEAFRRRLLAQEAAIKSARSLLQNQLSRLEVSVKVVGM